MNNLTYMHTNQVQTTSASLAAATVNFDTGTVLADVGLPEDISFLPAGTLKKLGAKARTL